MSKVIDKLFCCDLSYIPVRNEPFDASEMVTVMLFGEQFQILESRGNWHNVSVLPDKYSGWVFRRNLNDFFNANDNHEQALVVAPVSRVKSLTENSTIWLGMGSELPNYKDGSFTIDGHSFEIDSIYVKSYPELIAAPFNETVAGSAMGLLGIPYLWGGRSFWGIDCSGLTQIAAKTAGVRLNRDADMQIDHGDNVPFEERKRGDLAFFVNREGKVVHTGILISPDFIVHASEKVRVDSFTADGIKRNDSGELTHHLHALKRSG